jgi:hypothetical protein
VRSLSSGLSWEDTLVVTLGYAEYQINFLNSDGEIRSIERMICKDDNEALARFNSVVYDNGSELWRGMKKIGRRGSDHRRLL